MKTTSIFLIGVLTAVSVFGIFAMSTHGGITHDCPIVGLLSGSCQNLNDSLMMASHHLSGMNVLAQFLITLFALVLLSFGAFLAWPIVLKQAPILKKSPVIISGQRRQFFRLISLNNKSDSDDIH